jgi:hypothetical protein
MATEWYCKIMGEQWGPMCSEELVAFARGGPLTPNDVVKHGEQGIWVRAELVRGLFKLPHTAPTATSGDLVVAVQPKAPAKHPARSRAAKQYWIKIREFGTKAAGPFSAKQVREFAQLGALKPSHLVSTNRRHWSRAGRVRGLVFGGAAAESEALSDSSVA